jgi:hypothetical protein
VGHGSTTVRSDILDLSLPHRVEIIRDAAPGEEDWRIESLGLEDAPCPTDIDRAEAATRLRDLGR